MSWKHNDAGYYTRELSNREHIVQLIGSPYRDQNLEDWLIHAAVILDRPLQTSSGDYLTQWQNAWQQLRFENPGIAVELSGDGSKILYKPCALESERAAWLAASFSVNESATTPNDVYGTLKANPCAYLCIAPKAKAVIMCVQHWHGDGRGVSYLIGRLLKIINDGPRDPASLQWGAEEQRLPLCAEVLAGISANATPYSKSKIQDAARALLMVDSLRGIQVQGDLSEKCQASQLQVVALSQSRSEAIVTACKQKGLSVTAVFHAAVCLENIKQGTDSPEKPFTAVIRRDPRIFLPEPASRIENSADVIMSTSTFTRIDPRLGLLDFAKALQTHYKEGFTEDYFRTFDAALHAEILQMMLSRELVGVEPALEIQFSSLGKLDDSIPKTFKSNSGEAYRVQSFDFGITTYTPGVSGLWLYSFGGQIYMSIIWNTAYRTTKAMVDFLSSIEDSVVEGLAI